MGVCLESANDLAEFLGDLSAYALYETHRSLSPAEQRAWKLGRVRATRLSGCDASIQCIYIILDRAVLIHTRHAELQSCHCKNTGHVCTMSGCQPTHIKELLKLYRLSLSCMFVKLPLTQHCQLTQPSDFILSLCCLSKHLALWQCHAHLDQYSRK